MPTGYTMNLKIDTPFSEFAMQCARAFGACIAMRDEPSGTKIPEEFKPSPYHLKAIIKDEERLQRLEAMTESERSKQAEIAYTLALSMRQAMEEDRAKLKAVYERMLGLVQNWTPPTADHRDMKKFMIEQLASSIDHDCGPLYGSPPEKMSGEQWFAKEMDEASRDLAYHTKEHEEEVSRTNIRNQWLRDLRQSLAE